MSTPGAALSRSSIQLLRDCLRLVNHVAGKSNKGKALRTIVKTEFKKNSSVTDPEKILSLKSNAVRALANYLMIESANKDERFRKVASDFNQKEANTMRTIDKASDSQKRDS